MSTKLTFAEVVAEARSGMERWPESMKQLEKLRREEMRKLDDARAADDAPLTPATKKR